ncbi:uncharacterized protein LOC127242558 [Andrographis paniculata]|uniref:uncharacterized protein LOC127242558 n=1 Tax=Andrographis paniculata TaxID=175694 RepID=UPI0021E8DD5C|nr:uncharacterized protein LOC127242558 [Andrographis paniculata]
MRLGGSRAAPGTSNSRVGANDDEDVADGRIEITVRPDGSVFWPSSASGHFRPIFKSESTLEGIIWKRVPLITKQWYEVEMKKHIKWKPRNEVKVRRIYNKKACELYNKWVHEVRNSNDEKVTSAIPANVLEHWREHWKSKDAVKKSKIAKANRRGGNSNADAESTHTGGSRSFMETSQKMGLGPWGTYEWTHTKHHNGSEYCSTKANRIKEGMTAIEEGMSQLGDTEYSRDEALLSLVHRDNKKRIYGLGSLAATVPIEEVFDSSDGHIPSGPSYAQRLENLEKNHMTIIEQLKMIKARLDKRNDDGDSSAPPVC